MPKKEPSTLEDLALGSLEKYVEGIIRCAVGATGTTPRDICTNSLHRFLHADLPFTVSAKVADRMFKLVNKVLCETRDAQNVIRDVVSASLSRYMRKLKKLHTLSFYEYLPDELEYAGLFLSGLSSLKVLVKFQMNHTCTDATIIILVLNNYGTIEHIDVTGSRKVTDASFNSLMKCRKLRALLISGTSRKAEGYVEFLQYKKSDGTGERLVRLSVDRLTSRELDETAATCPKLRRLEIVELRGEMGRLCNLTELEQVCISESDFLELEGFLRVRGSNLIILELSEVTSLDLTCIVNHCFNLKELVLYQLTDIALGHRPTAKLSLEWLYMFGDYRANFVEHVLSSCNDISRLGVALLSEECLTDEHVLRFLLLFNLHNLKHFKLAVGRNSLSMKSANAIIEQCPLLEELGGVRTWRGVTQEQINDLTKKVNLIL